MAALADNQDEGQRAVDDFFNDVGGPSPLHLRRFFSLVLSNLPLETEGTFILQSK